MWQALTAGIEVPVSLHLDHCPDRAVISRCLAKGWNSVLFDGSSLPVAGEPAADRRGGRRGTVRTARTSRARSRRSPASRTASAPTRRRSASRCRLPSNSSGPPASRSSPRPSATPTASTTPSRRWTPSGSPTSSRRSPIPIALHGGTGLTDAQFADLIARGCAKVNISTALKVAYMQSSLEFLRRQRKRRQLGPAVPVHRDPGRGQGHGGRPHAPLRQRRPGAVTGR